MSTAAPMPDAELERRIAEQREKAEAALREASATRDPTKKRQLEDRARGHLQIELGLISRRTDAVAVQPGGEHD